MRITWKQDRDINAVAGGPFRRGVFENMPEAEYRAANGLNPSAIVYGCPPNGSMLSLRVAYEQNGKATDAQAFGTYVHAMLLEPHTLDDRFAVWNGGDKRCKGWKDFKAEHGHKLIIAQEDHERAINAALCATDKPEVRSLLAEGVSEVVVLSEEHGLQVKGRIDRLATDIGAIVDIKLMKGVGEQEIQSACRKYQYRKKLALYRRWFRKERGIQIDRVAMICVENVPPHQVVIVDVPSEELDWEGDMAVEVIGRVAQCIEADEWPGVADFTLTYMPWEIPNEPEPEVQFDD